MDDYAETTTHEPYPFFEDSNTVVNVTTQLGSHVYLHCRVNDLRGKTVRDHWPLCPQSLYR